MVKIENKLNASQESTVYYSMAFFFIETHKRKKINLDLDRLQNPALRGTKRRLNYSFSDSIRLNHTATNFHQKKGTE